MLSYILIGFCFLLLFPSFIFLSLMFINYLDKNYLKIIMRYLLDKLKSTQFTTNEF